jgi:hypothetical protein
MFAYSRHRTPADAGGHRACDVILHVAYRRRPRPPGLPRGLPRLRATGMVALHLQRLGVAPRAVPARPGGQGSPPCVIPKASPQLNPARLCTTRRPRLGSAHRRSPWTPLSGSWPAGDPASGCQGQCLFSCGFGGTHGPMITARLRRCVSFRRAVRPNPRGVTLRRRTERKRALGDPASHRAHVWSRDAPVCAKLNAARPACRAAARPPRWDEHATPPARPGRCVTQAGSRRRSGFVTGPPQPSRCPQSRVSGRTY